MPARPACWTSSLPDFVWFLASPQLPTKGS
jgi:hypothetical protein